MTHCPHCGEPIPPGALRCPHCGADLTGAWPPPPAGRGSGPAPPAPTDRGALRGFFTGLSRAAVWWYVGALVVYGLGQDTFAARLPRPLMDTLLFGPPLALNALGGLRLRPTRPGFARGLGWAALTQTALLLGAAAVCH